jgi:hypothetical protein
MLSRKAYHPGYAKDAWNLSVPPDTEVMVISDSNLRYVSRIPLKWYVHVLSGARFGHVIEAVKATPSHVFQKLRRVFIHIGINHRFDDVAPQPAMRDVVRCLRKFKVDIVFVGLSFSLELKGRPRMIVCTINDLACGLFDGFVPALLTQDVKISPDDEYRIHYTDATANEIMQSIVDYHCRCV